MALREHPSSIREKGSQANWDDSQAIRSLRLARVCVTQSMCFIMLFCYVVTVETFE